MHFLPNQSFMEPVLPQAVQQGIHFFFHNTQLEMLHLEGPD